MFDPRLGGMKREHQEDPMSDLPEELYGKISSEMDVFKKIASKIPGFAGYVERQNRRDADKLLRESLAKGFRKLEMRVSELQRDFISRGDIALVDDLEAAAIKLRTFADRVKTAERGYSGLFDAVKINENELARLYAFDAAMLDLVDEVGRAIDHVTASVGGDGLQAAIRNLTAKAQESVDVFNERDAVITSGGSPD